MLILVSTSVLLNPGKSILLLDTHTNSNIHQVVPESCGWLKWHCLYMLVLEYIYTHGTPEWFAVRMSARCRCVNTLYIMHRRVLALRLARGAHSSWLSIPVTLLVLRQRLQMYRAMQGCTSFSSFCMLWCVWWFYTAEAYSKCGLTLRPVIRVLMVWDDNLRFLHKIPPIIVCYLPR